MIGQSGSGKSGEESVLVRMRPGACRVAFSGNGGAWRDRAVGVMATVVCCGRPPVARAVGRGIRSEESAGAFGFLVGGQGAMDDEDMLEDRAALISAWLSSRPCHGLRG